MRTLAYLKKHGCHRPMTFEHLLDQFNRGRSERNSVWPMALKICKNLERNRPLVGTNKIFWDFLSRTAKCNHRTKINGVPRKFKTKVWVTREHSMKEKRGKIHPRQKLDMLFMSRNWSALCKYSIIELSPICRPEWESPRSCSQISLRES